MFDDLAPMEDLRCVGDLYWIWNRPFISDYLRQCPNNCGGFIRFNVWNLEGEWWHVDIINGNCVPTYCSKEEDGEEVDRILSDDG